MKDKIRQEVMKVYNQTHDVDEVVDNIITLFDFIDVIDETPPKNIELLAKSPTGVIHLTSWREAYSIFSCQCKGESTYGWSWKNI
jgi:hypothetical protein